MEVYSKDVKTFEEMKETLVGSLSATIETLKKTGLKTATVDFEFMGASVSCNIELLHTH